MIDKIGGRKEHKPSLRMVRRKWQTRTEKPSHRKGFGLFRIADGSLFGRELDKVRMRFAADLLEQSAVRAASTGRACFAELFLDKLKSGVELTGSVRTRKDQKRWNRMLSVVVEDATGDSLVFQAGAMHQDDFWIPPDELNRFAERE